MCPGIYPRALTSSRTRYYAGEPFPRGPLLRAFVVSPAASAAGTGRPHTPFQWGCGRATEALDGSHRGGGKGSAPPSGVGFG